MRRSGSFIAGLLCGAVLFGGVSAYAAETIAEISSHRVFVDGKEVHIEGYGIEGHNYFKLRDIGKQLGFNVYWDADTKTVQIESGKPYTGEPPIAAPSVVDTADYSAAIDPSVFTAIYTREAYDAACEVLTGIRAGDLTRTGTVHFSEYSDRQQYENLLAYRSNGVTLSVRGVREGEYEVFAHPMDLSVADTATENFIREVRSLSDEKEQVRRLNDWICDHMTYDVKANAGIEKVVTSSVPVPGNCASYASIMNYLCGRVGLPCTKVYGEGHCWNLIYADGAWGYTDVSLNAQVYGHRAFIFSDTPAKRVSDPDGVRFLQELLVPGSTC